MLRRSLILSAVAAFAVSSCKTRHANQDSDLQFSIGDTQNSMLKDIEATNGKLPVCVALIGFPKSETATAEASFRELLTRAADSWNSLLKGHPMWPVQNKIEPIFTVQNTKCPATTLGFNVIVWFDAAEFTSDYCKNTGRVCSSGASPATRTLYIGPVNRGMPQSLYQYATVLHEYGHMLSLGDTYRNPGLSDWDIDQPPSVMNGQNFPPGTFSEDDRWGLWATLYSVKTGRRSCGTYGVEVQMKLNTWQDVMCDPRSVAGYHHRSIGDVSGLPENARAESTTASVDRIPVDTGRWLYDGYDAGNTWMVVSEIEGHANSFRAFGFVNGETKSEGGTVYSCAPAIDVPFPRDCTTKSSAKFKIEMWGRKRLKLITPAIPAGLWVNWSKPELDWSF